MSRGTKKRSTFGILLDFILVLLTGGLWLIWILIRYLRNNS
jgi:hypothetical protein